MITGPPPKFHGLRDILYRARRHRGRAGAGRGCGIVKSGGGEQERRSALVIWVDRAADQAPASFRREVGDRVGRAERYLETALPQVLDARRRRLDQLADELRCIRSSTADLWVGVGRA
jgi:hypothetical protein